MPSPFPGMDPYSECQANWQDFHNRLVASICNVLGVALPGDYIAQTDEHIEIVGPDEAPGPHYRPDVLIAREPGRRSSLASPAGGTMTMERVVVEPVAVEPVSIEFRTIREEEGRSTWVEILLLPDLELVTVIEVLSPSNKETPGRPAYLRKRDDLHKRGINLVEIDLLLAGLRPPMSDPLPEWNYVAIVSRREQFPIGEAHRWSIRDPFPAIPIPLRAPDPDILLNLAPLTRDVYDTGRYGRRLRYDKPLPKGLPLRPEDREWSEGFGVLA